jgi:hypothetical protein
LDVDSYSLGRVGIGKTSSWTKPSSADDVDIDAARTQVEQRFEAPEVGLGAKMSAETMLALMAETLGEAESTLSDGRDGNSADDWMPASLAEVKCGNVLKLYNEFVAAESAKRPTTTLEIPLALQARLTALSSMTGRTREEIMELSLNDFGVKPMVGLSFEAATVLLAHQGADVMQVYNWIQDKVLTPKVVQRLGEFAVEKGKDWWLPACGGTEVICHGPAGRYLYVWQPVSNEHAYFDVDHGGFFKDERLREPYEA